MIRLGHTEIPKQKCLDILDGSYPLHPGFSVGAWPQG